MTLTQDVIQVTADLLYAAQDGRALQERVHRQFLKSRSGPTQH